MGQMPAGNVTLDLVRTWKPLHLLLVGIAGGIGDRSVRHGDVVVPHQVHYYEPGKLVPHGGRRGEELQSRWKSYDTSAKLREAVNTLMVERKPGWAKRISARRPDRTRKATPRILQDELASGEKVWAHRDADIVQEVLRRSDKIIAVDTEAAAVIRAVHESAQEPNVLVIKAISDLLDEKDDTWRTYAASAAAAFAVALIEKVGSRWRRQDGDLNYFSPPKRETKESDSVRFRRLLGGQ